MTIDIGSTFKELIDEINSAGGRIIDLGTYSSHVDAVGAIVDELKDDSVDEGAYFYKYYCDCDNGSVFAIVRRGETSIAGTFYDGEARYKSFAFSLIDETFAFNNCWKSIPTRTDILYGINELNFADTPRWIEYSDDNAIIYEMPFEIEYNTENEDIDYLYKQALFKLPIVAGDNVTFEVNEENQTVKINAVGSGGAALTMPIITMNGVSDTNGSMVISNDNPLTVFVRIIDGNLQVGDKIQICKRRLYAGQNQPKKYKLRAFVSYEITEEDLDKEVIGVEIAGLAIKNMLRGGGTNQSVVHNNYPCYIRVRREHPNNPSNALFSNLVPFFCYGKFDKQAMVDYDICRTMGKIFIG